MAASPDRYGAWEPGTSVEEDPADSLVERVRALDEAGKLAFAIERLPEIARLRTEDPTPEPFAQLQSWFAVDRPTVVYVRTDEVSRCTPVEAVLDGDVIVGKVDQRVRTRGGIRHDSWRRVTIRAWGIVVDGEVSRASKRGRVIEETTCSEGDCVETLTNYGVVKVDDERAEFGAESYGVGVACVRYDREEQRCIDGGERSCLRCTKFQLVTHAEGHVPPVAFSRPVRRDTLVACTQPCPPNPALEELSALEVALRDARFYKNYSHGPATFIYRRQKTCEADAAGP